MKNKRSSTSRRSQPAPDLDHVCRITRKESKGKETWMGMQHFLEDAICRMTLVSSFS